MVLQVNLIKAPSQGLKTLKPKARFELFVFLHRDLVLGGDFFFFYKSQWKKCKFTHLAMILSQWKANLQLQFWGMRLHSSV